MADYGPTFFYFENIGGDMKFKGFLRSFKGKIK